MFESDVNHKPRKFFDPPCDMTSHMIMVMMIIVIVVMFVTMTKLIMMILIFDNDDDHVEEEEFLSCQITSGCVSNCWQLKPFI